MTAPGATGSAAAPPGEPVRDPTTAVLVRPGRCVRWNGVHQYADTLFSVPLSIAKRWAAEGRVWMFRGPS